MRRLSYFAAGLAALAAACSDSPVGPDTDTNTTAATITQDLADIATDGAAEDIGMMSSMDGSVASWSGAAFLMPPDGPRVTGCNLGNGHFVCPREHADGLDIDRVVTFFDEAGATQTAYHNRTTASVHVVTTVSGDVTRGPWTATISRSRDFTITGLLGAETSRTVNGTGSENISRSGHNRNGGTRSYTLAGTSTVTNVVFPTHSETSEPWPLSGTITRTYTVTPLNGTPTTRTVVINFNGTSSPTGTVNGEAFTFDLTHRKAAKHPQE